MFFDVAAQSYEERRVEIERVRSDRNWDTIRAERVYPVIGERFGFDIPSGWSLNEYKSTILGDGVKPGFRVSFFMGGSKQGVVDSIKSIVSPATVEVRPPDGGQRWVLYDRAESPDPIIGGAEAWYLDDLNEVAAPSHRIVLNDANYFAAAAVVVGLLWRG